MHLANGDLQLTKQERNKTVSAYFLSHVSTLTRDTDIANLSVRPSIRHHVMVLDENSFDILLV